MLEQISDWRHTKLGHLVFGLVELVITFVFASLSLDRGNLLWYLLSLIFFIGTVKNFVELLGISNVKAKRPGRHQG